MRITAGLEKDDSYTEFWKGLEGLAGLGPREAEIVADTARQGIHENFKREQSPDGTPWPELAPMTQDERRDGIDDRGVRFSTGAKHPILRRTDDLLLSFIDPRHPRNITITHRESHNTRIALSATDDPRTPNRIENLNSGALPTPWRIIPARPFVGLSSKSRAQLLKQTMAILHHRIASL